MMLVLKWKTGVLFSSEATAPFTVPSTAEPRRRRSNRSRGRRRQLFLAQHPSCRLEAPVCAASPARAVPAVLVDATISAKPSPPRLSLVMRTPQQSSWRPSTPKLPLPPSSKPPKLPATLKKKACPPSRRRSPARLADVIQANPSAATVAKAPQKVTFSLPSKMQPSFWPTLLETSLASGR